MTNGTCNIADRHIHGHSVVTNPRPHASGRISRSSHEDTLTSKTKMSSSRRPWRIHRHMGPHAGNRQPLGAAQLMCDTLTLKRDLRRLAKDLDTIARRQTRLSPRTASRIYRLLRSAADLARHLNEQRKLTHKAADSTLNVRRLARRDHVPASDPISHEMYFADAPPEQIRALFIANNLTHECYIATLAATPQRPLEIRLTSPDFAHTLYGVALIDLAAWFHRAATVRPGLDNDNVVLLTWVKAA